jgi:hypothetical protein
MKMVSLAVVLAALMAGASNASAVTLVENFSGTVTGSNVNGYINFISPGYTIYGSNSLTLDSLGNATDFNMSFSTVFYCCGTSYPGAGGSHDYNYANDYNVPSGSRFVTIQDSYAPHSFSATGYDVVTTGGFQYEYVDVVTLNLTNGTGEVRDYYFQPGYSGTTTIDFNLTTVNGVGAPFPAVVPLPPAWTAMIIGLAGLGFVAYRRQRRSTGLVMA